MFIFYSGTSGVGCENVPLLHYIHDFFFILEQVVSDVKSVPISLYLATLHL